MTNMRLCLLYLHGNETSNIHYIWIGKLQVQPREEVDFVETAR